MRITKCMCCGEEIAVTRRYKLLNGFVTCVGHTFEFADPFPEQREKIKTRRAAAHATQQEQDNGERRANGHHRTR